MLNDLELITRAGELITEANFVPIARLSAAEYIRVADRVQAARVAAGASWSGVDSMGGARSTASVRRAAWARRTHRELAAAISDLNARRVTADQALARLRDWLPEAEAARPRTSPIVGGPVVRRPVADITARSKKLGLRELPADWMGSLWREAVDREAPHLDALAVVLATGCRPAEVCAGVSACRVEGGIEIAILSAKTTAFSGQPWRRLTVALDHNGPVAHLARLTDAAPDGMARVRAECSPGSFSMCVAATADNCGFTRRVSAYDIRHQRCSDARIAFGGDLDLVAAWMGHNGLTSLRHYGRLPRSSGVRGPRPLDASAARPVRHRALSPTNEARPRL